MDNNELVVEYLQSFWVVLSRLSSPDYGRMILENVVKKLKGKVINNIEILAHTIKLRDNISQVSIDDIKSFFNDMVGEFRNQVGHHKVSKGILDKVNKIMAKRYEDREHIELDIQYFQSLAEGF